MEGGAELESGGERPDSGANVVGPVAGTGGHAGDAPLLAGSCQKPKEVLMGDDLLCHLRSRDVQVEIDQRQGVNPAGQAAVLGVGDLVDDGALPATSGEEVTQHLPNAACGGELEPAVGRNAPNDLALILHLHAEFRLSVADAGLPGGKVTEVADPSAELGQRQARDGDGPPAVTALDDAGDLHVRQTEVAHVDSDQLGRKQGALVPDPSGLLDQGLHFRQLARSEVVQAPLLLELALEDVRLLVLVALQLKGCGDAELDGEVEAGGDENQELILD
ncbi:TPA: hypothetical protein DEP96_02205 [Candidatus Uhrbacteria bacterium]|nr:hypothetical protein [Candidatus Uhrbacteria bacterium]